jgi:hypothetical protein
LLFIIVTNYFYKITDTNVHTHTLLIDNNNHLLDNLMSKLPQVQSIGYSFEGTLANSIVSIGLTILLRKSPPINKEILLLVTNH